MLDYKYVTPEGEQALKQYTYKGGDASISYKYVFGPLAQWFIDNVVPDTVAYVTSSAEY